MCTRRGGVPWAAHLSAGMSTEPPKPGVRRRPAGAIRLEELSAQLEVSLDDPESLLEALVTASAKGQDVKAQWNLLHSAAVRHDKVSELAFAYEHVLHEKRIKLLPAEQQAAVNLHAVRFFSEAFGDPDGAITYAERALAIAPTHPDAFAVLEELLTNTGQPLRLAKIYLDGSQSEKNRDTQMVMLGRAAELVEQEAGADDLAIEVYQRILRIDSSALAARRALEQRLVAVGRTREGARLLEQRLGQTPPPNDDEARSMRQRLIELYVGALGDPKGALPHVEVLLASDPAHELARQVAERLLENKALASRASVALSDAYEKLGRREEAAALLAQELKVGRGPRRMEVQRRLGILKQEVLGDPAGALELLAPVVAGDPGDDALRRRFVELSESLGQPLEAARLLTRALGQARDAAVRARVLADVGRVQQRAGDMKAAQVAYAQVLETGHDDGAVLIAARQLAEVYAEARALGRAFARARAGGQARARARSAPGCRAAFGPPV